MLNLSAVTAGKLNKSRPNRFSDLLQADGLHVIISLRSLDGGWLLFSNLDSAVIG
jgi:hypothetical protein